MTSLGPRLDPSRDTPPRCARARRRRAVALLIVLACLVVVSAAAASLASAAFWSRQAHVALDADIAADALLIAAQGPIQRWLNERSAQVVLGPDALVPEVPVLHDLIPLPGTRAETTAELRITAFDQCGMVPLSLLATEPLLRAVIPDRALDALRERPPPAPGPPGLDAWEFNGLWPAFPRAATPFPPAAFGPTRAAAAAVLGGSGREPPGPPALGACLATHNPPPRSSSLPHLNVSTAPIPILEAAMRSEGLGGLDAIVQARAAGRRPTVSAERADESSISFAPFSTCWAFRIDARVGPVSKSWWAIYSRSAAGWALEQRLAIRE